MKIFFTAPSNFQVGIYSAGVDSLTPGSLISYLSGPESPIDGAYNSYTPTTSITLNSGSQYWLGFTLASDYPSSTVRARIESNDGSTSYLGSGWSYGQRYIVGTGAGLPANSTRPATFQIYATAVVCFCKGTLIRDAHMQNIPIENIRIGTVIATSHGNLTVKWVAKRSVKRSLSTDQFYKSALPVKIEANAFEAGIPSQDLYVQTGTASSRITE